MGSIDKIRKFWDQRARDHHTAPTASMGDVLLMDREVDNVQSYIRDGQRVLDVGCANGYSTLLLASRKTVIIDAYDYSREMISYARKALATAGSLKGTVRFSVDDVLKHRPKREAYDVIYAIRCIINLPTLRQQLKSLDMMWPGVKPGGMLILSDATLQGWRHINGIRAASGMKETPMPWHNLYLDIDAIREHMAKKGAAMTVDHFASTYYWGTRYLRPRLLGDYSAPNYRSLFNKIFIRLPNIGKGGIQKTMVFRKR